jgi:DeoR/GlpR family transcriptional regulator of sugar metabolism
LFFKISDVLFFLNTIFSKKGEMNMGTRRDERLNRIRQLLDEKEKMRTSEIARMLNVTPETIRHDLNTLEDMNLVRREHGWVTRVSSLVELPILERGKENTEDKRRASWRAMQEISDGMVVFLDSGSTVLAGLPFLTGRKDVTIVTNSIPLAYQGGRLNLNLVLCGGTLMNIGLRTVGADPVQMIAHFNFDLAVLGTDGIFHSSGFTTLDYSEVPIKNYLAIHAARSIVVADASKFNKKASCSFCTYHEIDTLITNPLTEEQRTQVKDVPHVIEI